MKKEFNSMWGGFRNWVHYVLDYKENTKYCEIKEEESTMYSKKLNTLEKKLKQANYLEKEKDELIAILNKRINALGNELSITKKRNNELRNIVAILYEQNETLETKIEDRELLRRKAAGKVGGLKATITKQDNEIKNLHMEISKLEMKINWLKHNQKAPTKEEILAYEKQMKEVEKRLKDGRSNNNI